MFNFNQGIETPGFREEFDIYMSMIDEAGQMLQSGQEITPSSVSDLVVKHKTGLSADDIGHFSKFMEVLMEMMQTTFNQVNDSRIDAIHPVDLELPLLDLPEYTLAVIQDLAINEQDAEKRAEYVAIVALVAKMSGYLDGVLENLTPIARDMIYNLFILPATENLKGEALEGYADREDARTRNERMKLSIAGQIRGFNVQENLIHFNKKARKSFDHEAEAAEKRMNARFVQAVDRILNLFGDNRRLAEQKITEYFLGNNGSNMASAFANPQVVDAIEYRAGREISQMNIYELMFYYLVPSSVSGGEPKPLKTTELVLSQVAGELVYKCMLMLPIYNPEICHPNLGGSRDQVMQRTADHIVQNYEITKSADWLIVPDNTEQKSHPYTVAYNLVNTIADTAYKTANLGDTLKMLTSGFSKNRPNDLFLMMFAIMVEIFEESIHSDFRLKLSDEVEYISEVMRMIGSPEN